MRSRLVVLGSSSAWPEAGRACTGYLLEHGGFRLVLDLGYGTVGRLLDLLGSSAAANLDAVVVTHRHPDHMVDLHALFRARSLGLGSAPTLPLLAPEGVVERLKALEEDDGSKVDEAFDVRPLPGVHDLGPFRLEAVEVTHSVPAVGVRLSTDRLTVAWTGDTGYDDALAGLGRDADLFVVEATQRNQQQPDAEQESRTHLTAQQAGAVAAEAGAKRLMLTHFWPGNDREQARADAARAFDGEILIADEGLEVGLP